MENQNEKTIFNLSVDDESSYNFLEFAKWARFLGIIGFVFSGLLILVAIGLLFVMASNLGFSTSILMFILYAAIGLLYLYPALQIFKSGKFLKSAIHNNDQIEFNNGIKSLKNCFKFMGILIIFVIAIYAILIIFLLAYKGDLIPYNN